MRRFATASSAACLGLLVLASAALADPPPSPRPVPAERWRITGQPRSDGCGGQIHLAARHLTFRGRTMHADVVDRTYAFSRHGAQRIAEGDFVAGVGCDGTTIFERWKLREVSRDVLEGTLTSSWHLPPACDSCVITFQIRAERVR